jgi:predicted RNase H-like HicB family nuclease
MTEYAVVYELASDGTWSAYVPDLPGCVCSAESRSAIRERIRETIAFHLEGLRLNNLPIPMPSSNAEMVSVKDGG